MAVLGVRVWRTADGRHVHDGHADAAFLAYGAGDDVPDHAIPAKLRDEPDPAPPAAKARPQAPNKARGKQADK